MTQAEQAFLAECRELNDKLKASQNVTEPISDERLVSCIVLVRQLKLIGIGDALRFLTAINGLNAYSCQDGSEYLDDFYKSYFDILVKFLKGQESELVRMEIHSTDGVNTIFFEIAEIQFSFRINNIGSQMQDLVAKDMDHTEIEWDGIRKKRCVETLCVFADENAFESNGKAMDGSLIEDKIQTETEAYQKENKSLRAVAGLSEKSNKEKQNHEQTVNCVVDTKEYPFRTQPVNMFYGGTVVAFLNNLRERRMVPFLKQTYEDGYGYQLRMEQVNGWKYQFEALRLELEKAQINESCGALLLHIQNMEQDYFILFFGGIGPEGRPHTCAIQLLPWTKVALKENPALVSYQTEMVQIDLESVHPSIMMGAYKEFMMLGIVDKEFYGLQQLFTYLYDCTLQHDTDIVTGVPASYLAASDVVYANQTGRVCDLSQGALYAGDGMNMINVLINSLNTKLNILNPTQLPDRQYVKTKLNKSLNSESSFLTVVHARCDCGENCLWNDVIADLARNGYSGFSVETKEDLDRIPDGTKLVFYRDIIPEVIDYEKIPYHVLFFDSYSKTVDELKQVEKLAERADDLKILHWYGVTTCIRYCDLGSGNSWLIHCFALGVNSRQVWDPSFYHIRLVESASCFTGQEGIAAVTVPSTISYSTESNAVIASRADQIALYEELMKGENGVELLIEDAKLCDYIKKQMETYCKGYTWVAQYQRMETSNEQVMKVREDIISDSAVHFKAEAMACSFIGASAYHKLSLDSQNWLLSALLSFFDMRSVSQLMDYTGVVLMICKCYEQELKIRIGVDYVEWSKERYGEDDYLNHLTNELKNSRKDYKEVIDFDELTIGSYTYIMGYYPDGGVCNKKDRDEFQRYAEDHLLEEPENAEATIKSLVKIITNVRTKYRNKAAHTTVIDVVLATDCIEYCVTKDKTLGVMMDAFRY